jgi:hypothetical protein
VYRCKNSSCYPEFKKVPGITLLINPIILIEIISSSIESFDRGGKAVSLSSIMYF